MLITFQDRLRIPWRSSVSMYISLGSLLPAIVIPLAIGVAAINLYVTIIMSIFGIAFVLYAYFYFTTRKLRSRFFYLWIFWSVIYMAIFFECTVPLLELLPEENLVLVLLTTISLLSLWRTKKRGTLCNNHKDCQQEIVENKNDEAALLIEDVPNEKFEQPIGLYYYSYWLNCSIGEWNYRSYIIGLILAEIALLLGANLTLTAICHPFLIVRLGSVPIMLPDDCSEIYYDYKQGVSFVIAVYALIVATSILITLIWQFCRRNLGHNIIYVKKCTNWH